MRLSEHELAIQDICEALNELLAVMDKIDDPEVLKAFRGLLVAYKKYFEATERA